jgi:glycosyltransferase involved in cell wall biosynthesis
MHKKIFFILDVRYPTEKAYGVTTKYTVEAIESLNRYIVTIITPKSEQFSEMASNILEVAMPLNALRELGMNQKKLISKVTYHLWKAIYAFKLMLIIDRQNTLIWLRDVRLAVIFSILRYKVVCEIHREPSNWLMLEFKILKRLSNVTLAVISQNLKDKLRIKNGRSVIAEMAVNHNELLNKPKVKKNNQFIVGYVGSPHSSGNKLSIDVVIEAAVSLMKLDTKIQFKFIGFNFEEVFSNYSVMSQKNFEFLGRLTRSNLFDELDSFDIGLVIYPDEEYFLDSFPIKIVEYAARRVPIVASNTRAHNRILGADKAIYFDLNSSKSLTDCILKIKNDKNLASMLSHNAFNWVQELTYLNRARKVLAKVEF